MYFAFTPKKVRLAGGAIAALVLLVAATHWVKEREYGDIPLTELFTRAVHGEFRTFRYSLRSLSASAPMEYLKRDEERTAIALPALTYHAIVAGGDEDVSPESFEGHNVSLEAFEDQMFTLKENGWETITLEELSDFVREGKALPERSFLLTFDDGAKESYYPVDPLLKVLGYEAVTFILPNAAAAKGSSYYLSEAEIARALRSGRWEIGSHGDNSHAFVKIDEAGAEAPALGNREWKDDEGRLESLEEYHVRVRQDLEESRRKLEEAFNIEVDSYAFPFGEFGQLSENVPDAQDILPGVAADIYDHAFYQWWEGEGFTFNYPEENLSMLKRVSVRPQWTGEELLALLEAGLPKDLPYTDAFDSDRGWMHTWGNYEIRDGNLIVSATPEETGASLILDGTKHWSDYSVRLFVKDAKDTGVVMFARYRDPENYAACNIGDGFAHVEQVIDGEHRVIKGNRAPGIAVPQVPFSVDMSVKGRTVSCAIDGQVLVDTTFLDESLSHGGIGIKVWNRLPGVSRLEVDAIKVTSRIDEDE